MENFIKQLLSQIVTYLVFLFLMLFTFACLMTGEFPPKIKSVKTQYQALLELKNNTAPLLKMAAEKLRAGDQSVNASASPSAVATSLETIKGQMIKQSDLSQALEQVRIDQARIKIQMDLLIQQNNEILKLLPKNQRQ